MGLGSADPRFMAVNEEDILPVVDNNGEDAALELVDGGLMNAEDEMVEVIAIDDD